MDKSNIGFLKRFLKPTAPEILVIGLVIIILFTTIELDVAAKGVQLHWGSTPYSD